MLHGYGDSHADALSGLSPARALALRVAGAPLPPMALVTVDGGAGYWNPHPGDNPQAMLTDELIPLCQRSGLGSSAHRRHGHLDGRLRRPAAGREVRPDLISAVAAISPAIWTSYAQARAANAGAYASAADFAADDAVTHAAALARIPVRVAAGFGDPFYPGVQALARALPKRTGGEPPEVSFSNGCHDGPFFTAQEPPSLAFLGRHLTTQNRHDLSRHAGPRRSQSASPSRASALSSASRSRSAAASADVAPWPTAAAAAAAWVRSASPSSL